MLHHYYIVLLALVIHQQMMIFVMLTPPMAGVYNMHHSQEKGIGVVFKKKKYVETAVISSEF